MIKDITPLLSKNALSMKRSEIRELLKVTRRPDIISFAGGLPSPETFPVKDIEDVACEVLRQKGSTALQYGPTEGEIELRQEIAKWMNRENPAVKPEDLVITSGSQQGLDITAKIFLDPGDIAIVELPSYIGGLQAFYAYSAMMVGIPQDENGMRTDLLRETMDRLVKQRNRIKFIYVVPDFQNPSGVTMSGERREELLQIAYKYEIPVIEDSPYRDLRYAGKAPTPIHRLDTEYQTIFLSTFSKILGPGLRLAWIMAPSQILERMIVAKQGMDLCPPTFVELIVAEYMSRGLLDSQIERIRVVYGKKREVMLQALEEYMPDGVEWSKPEGGLFLWVRLPEHMSATQLFPKAIESKVAYVVGSAFHCDGKGQNTMRLNFSYPTEQQIDEGIKRLAKMIKENM